jgi:hypothetical protein
MSAGEHLAHTFQSALTDRHRNSSRADVYFFYLQIAPAAAGSRRHQTVSIRSLKLMRQPGVRAGA